MRTFSVIVRGEETQGVRFWGFGKTVHQITFRNADPDYGDITDPVSGRDVSESLLLLRKVVPFPKTSIRSA